MTERPEPTAVRRPWTLWAALAMVALEVAVLVVSAGFFVVLSRSGDTEVGSSLLSLAVMFGVLALGLVAVIMGLYRMHRWARPATVAWQVLLILFGLSVLGSGWLLPVGSIVPAVLCLAALFAPPSLAAYGAAIAEHEARARAAQDALAAGITDDAGSADPADDAESAGDADDAVGAGRADGANGAGSADGGRSSDRSGRAGRPERPARAKSNPARSKKKR